MDIRSLDRIKHRLIPFSGLHPDQNQAETAAGFLAGLEGILHVEPISAIALKVSYDVLQMTLLQIEETIGELGLHLDRNLMYRIRSALYHYTEETQRANCGCPGGERNCTKRVFAQRYGNRDHSCRDHKPEHWREYL
jgi:hypothetical protein